jgi:hypothetical protein
MSGFPSQGFDALVNDMAEIVESPDDPLRTFPTGDPYVRRADFGDAGLVIYCPFSDNP